MNLFFLPEVSKMLSLLDFYKQALRTRVLTEKKTFLIHPRLTTKNLYLIQYIKQSELLANIMERKSMF